MASLSISGAGSGIDWRSMVDAMMDAERVPLGRMAERRLTLDVRKTVWSGFKVSLSTITSRLSSLSYAKTFSAKQTRISDDRVASVQVTASVAAGQYRVEVLEVAHSHVVASSRFEETINGWSGEFSVNGTIVTVEESDTLQNIMDKINAAQVNVNASVIDRALVLRSTHTGMDHQILLEDVEGSPLQELGLLDAAGEPAHELIAAQDALLTFDGLEITRSSNEVGDVLPGFLLTLHAVGDTTIRVDNDLEAAVLAVKGWIEAYNSFMTKVANEGGESGSMRADSTLLRIERGLRSLVMAPVLGGSSLFQRLEDIGISGDAKSALLQLDESRLRSALHQDAHAVQQLFFDPQENVAGVGERLQERILALVSSPQGIIVSKEKEIDRIMDGIGRSMDRMNMRMEQREQNLISRFVAMEEALNVMQTQAEWMFQWAASQSNLNRNTRR